MAQLKTLLLASLQAKCKVMTPDGPGILTNLRMTGAPLATVALESRTGGKVTLNPDLVTPVLKGFVLFRGEVLDGTSPVIDYIMSRVTPIVGPHKLEGVFTLPISYDMSRPCIESALQIQANDVVADSDLGRIRITENFELFWQPSNHFNAELSAEDMSGKVIEQVDLGWLPLHVDGLRDYLLSHGYAAEMPLSQYITPMTANMLKSDASLRNAHFYGISNN